MTAKQILYIFLFLFATVSLATAQQAKISGTVTNFDNKPVDFVRVSIKGSISGDFTNGQGKYQITVPMGDSITLEFSSLGYQKAERKIEKVSGNMVVNIMLREKVLEEVTVTGSQAQTNTMGKIELGNSNLLTDPSIEARISMESGVSKTNELSNQYSVRGGNYDENLVYVNGIEIYRPLLIRSAQQEGLSFLNPSMTKDVKFSTGGFDASYGDKMSSVLDITYKQPTEFEAMVSGSLLGANAYIGSSTGRFSQITGFRYKTTKNLLGTTDTEAEYDPEFIDAQTYMTFKIAPKWEVSFLGNLSSNVFKFTPQSRETKYGSMSDSKNFKVYFDGWEHDKFLTYFGALSLKGKLTENLELGFSGSAFSTREYERYDISGEYQLTDAGLESGGVEDQNGSLLAIGSYLEHARNKLNADVSTLSHSGSFKFNNHDIKWGFTFQKEKIEDKIKEWTVRDSAGYSIPNVPNLVSVYTNQRGDNSINSNRYSGYVQDTYRFTAGESLFYLNAGVRFSHWTFNKETIISPRASLAYVPSSSFVLRFATGLYYQAPFYKEYQRIVTTDGNSVIELNKDIKSQKSLQFVLGGDYKFTAADRPFKFTSEVYYKHLTDLVPYTVDNVKIRYSGENSGKGYAMGLDMKLFGEFIKGTDSWISLSLMKTQQEVDGIKAPLPTDQGYNLSFFFRDYFPGIERLTMNLSASLSQGLPQTPPNSGFISSDVFRTPAYKRVDIGFAWQVLGESFDIRNRSAFCGSFKNIWLGADIFNLFDIKNTNSYYWINDVFNQQYAVPNYLTGRQINFKIVAEF
ncbi:TonB-dependent receptor [Dysgonomonas macrotermitis]|uniref:Outer membrane receptor proteins, mostly Fe transport n=1 Tax=Dysgonomonas macrotermitis TaxID=1346286 RepID=A0A1M5BGL9_9BACT|nr:TonB-dependent receptor [Dysgonomonas macrotermitis]SHF41618.1 Outer membrane receptor proteins, mostly Fe transport [Dysgonomonas macrotermitis]